MIIQNLYQKYEIMPTLQQHMLRVAAVAKQLCDHWQGPPIDKTAVVAACLVHDLGNILKFDLTRFPEFLEPQGLDYWGSVQEKFRERYGLREHVATELILEELKVAPRIKELVQAIGFNEAQINVQNGDYEKKLCDYADTRVDPFGVVSLDDRLADLAKRYGGRYTSRQDRARREQYDQLMHQLEEQVFTHCTIRPQDVTNKSVNDTITNLIHFVVPLQEQQ